MIFQSPFVYFTDSVLRAPTLGCMFMCLAAGMIGVIVFLRKQSLIGECLSHAAYPGVIGGVLTAGFWLSGDTENSFMPIFVLGGAFVSALLGLWCITLLQRYLRVRIDSALCFTLSAFFGVGITLASRIQFTHTALYNQIQVYLYGQAATMTDIHIALYATLAGAIFLAILMFYKEIQAMTFDRDYAKSLGIKVSVLESFVFIFIVLAVVVGIRSVGVVLMSAMLIAPAAAARQFTHKLSVMLLLASGFGIVSGFMGNYLSVELTQFFNVQFPLKRFSLPTGPMIVLVASILCLGSLLLAPERGLLIRLLRILKFRHQCLGENILKTLWRLSYQPAVGFDEIRKYQNVSIWYLRWILKRLVKGGWIIHEKNGMGQSFYFLTGDGKQRAMMIVRLHRLWEVYLADYLGVGAERVHCSAEEMEHIITPELEKKLTDLLNNPQRDPHHQPIPSKEMI